MAKLPGSWTASPTIFGIILSLFYILLKYNLPLTYYGYTNEVIPICILEALVMF
jgi:hypothetical protein